MLRNEVGDAAFFEILKQWTSSKAGGNGTNEEFIALAERVSGRQLDELFNTWLYTAGKPELPAAATELRAQASPAAAGIAQELRRRAQLGRH